MVFAPCSVVTVTVERFGQDDDIHFHAGGQGFWVARMVAALDMPVTLCGPFGGEAGGLARMLIQQEPITLRAVAVGADNGAYVHDRRDGERQVVADMRATPLSRHEQDELYGAAIVEGLAATVTVIAGPSNGDVLPVEFYRRLAHDLRTNGRTVVVDVSGAPLRAALEGGVNVLKVSHTEMRADGWVDSDAESEIMRAMHDLRAAGAHHVVVSRAEAPSLVLTGDGVSRVIGPRFEAVDHRGAGDSLTAGIATGLARGLRLDAAIRLGTAAGALNVTRHGLASGDGAAIAKFVDEVQLVPVAATGAGAPEPTTSPAPVATRGVGDPDRSSLAP